MKLARIALFLAATACGSAHKDEDVQPNETQQEPAYYVAKYEALARPHLLQDFKVTTEIQIVDTVAGTAGSVGSCVSTTNRIDLLKSYWDNRNGTERKEVLYHELAHCNQFRPHLDTTRVDGTPTSLMTSGLLPDWKTFQSNEGYYETELFAVAETCGVSDALPCRK